MTLRSGSPLTKLSSSVFAMAFGLVLAFTLMVCFSSNPLGALKAFFTGPVSSSIALGQWLNQAGILTLTGLAAALAFSAGTFNLGGEGQTYFGALACTVLALTLPFGGLAGILLCLLIGLVAGLVLGGLSGVMKARWGADELITSFLISNAVLPLVDTLLTDGPLKDPASFLITSKSIAQNLRIPGLLDPSGLNWGVFAALPLAVICSFVLFGTPWGYRWRLTGENRQFAHYVGIRVNRYSFFPICLSGGLHGFAGAVGVLGTQFALVQGFSFGWGWNGIAVALIARNHPLWVIPSAMFFAYLDQGARWTVLMGQFPFQLSALFQAVILFFVTAQIVLLKRRGKK